MFQSTIQDARQRYSSLHGMKEIIPVVELAGIKLATVEFGA